MGRTFQAEDKHFIADPRGSSVLDMFEYLTRSQLQLKQRDLEEKRTAP